MSKKNANSPNRPTPEQIANLRQGSIWLSIVSQLFTSRMNKLLAPHDMTLTQFSILNHLASREIGVGNSISQIAEAVEALQPAVTKIINKFEKLELVEQSEFQKDQRSKQVRISQKGGQVLIKIQKDIGQDLGAMFNALDEDELSGFISSLKKIGVYLDTTRV